VVGGTIGVVVCPAVKVVAGVVVKALVGFHFVVGALVLVVVSLGVV